MVGTVRTRTCRRAMSVIATTLVAASLSNVAHAEAPVPKETETKLGPVTLLASALGGTGLRFNNPYRLATPLGSSAESVSRTNAWMDFGLTVFVGNPTRVVHGVSVRFMQSVEGVAERNVTPSYVLGHRSPRLLAYGRIGVPFVTTPRPNVGLEGALGAFYFLRAGIGLGGELVGDIFYGAGTATASRPVYPILGAQAGLIVSYEMFAP
jgi:hypothetical protein